MRTFKSTLSTSTKVRTHSITRGDESQMNNKSFIEVKNQDMSPYIEMKKSGGNIVNGIRGGGTQGGLGLMNSGGGIY
jgi:hypothetical protein